MHVLTLTKPLDIGPNGILEAGEYIVENSNGGQLLAMTYGATLRPFDWFIPKLELSDTIVVRPGGFGDLILLTPAIRGLMRSQTNGTKVRVACFPQYITLFDGTGIETIPYPIRITDEIRSSNIIFLEDSVEHHEDGRTLHMTDVFCKRLGVDPEDKKAEYFVSDEERSWAEKYVKKHWPIAGPVKRAAIQTQASTHCRTPPQLGEVVAQLYAKGWHCFLLGSPYSIPVQNKLRITNCTLDNLTFRQSAAVLDACDIILGPDSALIHVAGAINKPAVGLYGAFPWQLRTAYAPNTIAIQGHGECAPCFYHGRNGEHFPRNGPCHKVGKCVVLDSIIPEAIVQKVEAHFKAMQERPASSGCVSLTQPESPASSPS